MYKIAFNQIYKLINWMVEGNKATCSLQSAIVPQRKTMMIALSEMNGGESKGKLWVDVWGAVDASLEVLSRSYGCNPNDAFNVVWIAVLADGRAFMSMRDAQANRSALDGPDWQQLGEEHKLGLLKELGFSTKDNRSHEQ